MSLDVNTVSTDTIMYRYKNSFTCPVLARFSVTLAKYLKNCSSSRKMDSTVMDMNSTKIFRGLMADSLSTSPLPTLSNNSRALGCPTNPATSTMTAPTSVTTQ